MQEPKKIRVCHFTSAHPSDDVRIFHKECVTLAEAGFHVTLVVANGKEEVVQGVNIVSANVPPAGRYSRMLKTSRSVYKKALSLDADIYHFHDPELLPYGLKLKKRGKKVIFDAHEDVSKQIMGKFWINKYLRKIASVSFHSYENYIAKRLDYILTATPFIRDRFLEVNKNSIDINNYPMLSELQDESDWKNKKNEICYIGGMTKIRGIEELVDAISLVEGIKLNLAGDFDQESFKNELMAKPAWTEKIIAHGLVSRKETAKIMAESKIGIVTFLPLPNHVDAQPNKMFEYMSAAIPVIGSDFPLWREIIIKNKCGICVDPENPAEIAEAIVRIISDEEKSKEMGRNGRRMILEKYNWSIEAKKLIGVYNLVMQVSK